MSKPWICIILSLWTAVMLLMTPFLFSITREFTESSVTTGFASLTDNVTMTVLQKRPVLDWTGKLAQRLVRVSWGDKHFDLPWSQPPYQSITISRDEKGKIQKNITTPDHIVLKFQ